MMLSQTLSAKVISGKVISLSGEPIAFASLLLPQGKQLLCNEQGEFCFPVDAYAFPLAISVSASNFESRDIELARPGDDLKIELAPRVYQLGDIMVLQSQSLRAKSNAAVLSVDKAEVEERMPLHVTDLLGAKAGFTQRSGYQVPLILRGLSGKRLLVLRNGNRRFSSYPAGFMSHTINVYDLDRVEVEKGAASVRYGSGAIAGIVNLIDAFPFDTDGMNGKLTAGYGTNNDERILLASVSEGNEKLAGGINLRYRKAGSGHYPDGTTIENSFYEDKDFLAKTAWKMSAKSRLDVLVDLHWGGPWGKPKGFSGTEYLLATTNIEDTRNISMNWTFQANPNWKSVVSAYFSHEKRELEKRYFTAAGHLLSFQEVTDYTDYYYGASWTLQHRIGEKWTLNTGTSYYSFHISSPTESNDYIQNLSFRNRVSINARSIVAGAFGETIFRPGFGTSLAGGLRFDYDHVQEGEVYSLKQDKEGESHIHAVSASIGGQTRLSEQSHIKLNLARSFRMPETTELFADNYTARGILYGNTELKPEYCHSIDMDYQQTIGKIELDLSPFLWLMKDMITMDDVKGQPGTNFQYTNVGKARLWGGELMLTVPVQQLLQEEDELVFSAGASYLNGTDVSDGGDYFGEGEPLDFVPPFNLKSELHYHYQLSPNISSHGLLAAVYYSEQRRLPDDGYATPAYVVTDLSLGFSFGALPCNPSLRLVVNNLTNKDYETFQSYLPAEGRNFRFYVTFNLN
ncbi:TonB-dependent receptor plug domain-containing protein [Mangrovibacterium diazotrophicum]|uniref:Outer membrane receptor protein involved in Fe transport n=1 Tax=Mangrovibacterium diazotrophicum TaxID=1261403 RepID=A0A419W4L8_9BACT|nr:TonB-dependent receptor [Mangrovibacterium diazotrophicum]RKD90404.1 outer membrane receptor protein involved in Fe transport [Mangrovibacterium diazotrophicum]